MLWFGLSSGRLENGWQERDKHKIRGTKPTRPLESTFLIIVAQSFAVKTLRLFGWDRGTAAEFQKQNSALQNGGARRLENGWQEWAKHTKFAERSLFAL
ncbi:MAG: hypothetical protein ACRD1I_05995 [Terriglobia bacterium]